MFTKPTAVPRDGEEHTVRYEYWLLLPHSCIQHTPTRPAVCLRRVRVGKNVSDRFPIRNGLKQGDAVSPVLFNFALEYAITRVQVNQDGLKLNGTHQLLAYADDVDILGGSIHTLKKNVEALVAAAREIELEVNADKTKYMVLS